MNQVYEVYVCSLGDEVLYVGQGDKGRHKHCNSGCSHVYELNRLHFLGNRFDVKVEALTDSKREALDLELSLIKSLKPKFNKNFGVSKNAKIINKINRARGFFSRYPKEKNIDIANEDYYLELVDEFFRFHNGEIVVGGSETLAVRGAYKKYGYLRLSQFVRYLMDNHKTYPDKNYCVIFCRCFSEYYGFHPKYLLDGERLSKCNK